MEQINPLVLDVRLTAKDLWKFSMYHSYRGFQGVFSFLFSAAALYVLVATWTTATLPYRTLIIVCALMFTVWQPFVLYMKAARQEKKPVIRNGMALSFSAEGIVVTQGQEKLELLWEDVIMVKRVGKLLIIYMDRIHAYLLPDSVAGEKAAELTALMKENLPPERRKRI
nr:YcxB family protein [uncultured Clostridium sp.]